MIYTHIKDVPLDLAPAYDVVDVPDEQKPSALNVDAAREQFAPLLIEPIKTATTPSYVIPFRRVLRKNTRGRDVIGAKRAIWKANGLPVPKGATATFGPIAVKQLQAFQHRHGLRATGELGSGTLAKLAPYFDAYAFLLYVGYAPGNVKQAKRNAFVAYMLWGYNHRALLHYAQQRPMDLLGDLEHLPGWDDCSEWFTKGAKYAGFPDPNGMRPAYNGSGWTGTLAVNGKAVSLAKAQPGAAVLYGPAPNYEHVAGYIGFDRVCSFGSDPGPLLLPIDYRGDRGPIRDYLI